MKQDFFGIMASKTWYQSTQPTFFIVVKAKSTMKVCFFLLLISPLVASADRAYLRAVEEDARLHDAEGRFLQDATAEDESLTTQPDNDVTDAEPEDTPEDTPDRATSPASRSRPTRRRCSSST